VDEDVEEVITAKVLQAHPAATNAEIDAVVNPALVTTDRTATSDETATSDGTGTTPGAGA
jgi:hypothetical protein